MLELIQNADDNAYAEGVHPTLAFLPGARRTNRRPFPVHPWVGPPLDNRRMLVNARGRISFFLSFCKHEVVGFRTPLSPVSDGGGLLASLPPSQPRRLDLIFIPMFFGLGAVAN